MSLTIPGLPEGITAIRIGIAEPTEFEFYNGELFQGKRHGSISQIIVVPAEGFAFIYSIRDLAFHVVKKFATPVDIVSAVRFRVDNSSDLEVVNANLERLKELPGYVGETP